MALRLVRFGPSAGLRIEGTQNVLNRLNAEIANLEGPRAKGALQLAGLAVLGQGKRYTPVDTGNLRGSAYLQPITTGLFGTGATIGVEIGYTASYAVFVHERDLNYRKPGTGWKFLERALEDKATEVLQILGSNLDLSAQIAGERISAGFQETPLADFGTEMGWVG